MRRGDHGVVSLISVAATPVSRPSHERELCPPCEKNPRFRGDKSANNGDNRQRLCCRDSSLEKRKRLVGKSSVITARTSTLLSAAIAGHVLLTPIGAQAQWWSARAPADFEECADRAEKAATKEAKSAALSDCHSKFAGRRKLGGGYTYFDFMQNRHFDIAGPNPTPEEQQYIDEQYIAYLEQERRSTIAAAFLAKQQQQQQVQRAAFKSETEKVPVPRQSPVKQQAANDLRSRTRATNCTKNSFSCEWPRLSAGLNDLKKLFGPSQGSPQAKAKRS